MLTMRKIVGQQLKMNGATMIKEATDGAPAWDIIQTDCGIQVVISDWNMPVMKGVDLLRKIRGNPKYKDLGFLMVTAEAEVLQVKEAVIAGVDNYVVKPFTPQALMEKIESVLKKRALS
jgi:two-component system chemotaxis response regulator CheY